MPRPPANQSETPAPTAAPGFDLGQLIDQDTARVPINDEAGNRIVGQDGEPWYIEVAGPTHDATKEARNIGIRQSLSNQRRARLKGAALENIQDQEIEEIANQQLEPLAIRTVGWGPISLGGKPFPFSRENARQMYRTSQLIRNQVAKFLEAETSFLRR